MRGVLNPHWVAEWQPFPSIWHPLECRGIVILQILWYSKRWLIFNPDESMRSPELPSLDVG